MITITREPTYADRLRSYAVELDGKIIGSINTEETKSFELKPGHHTLRLKIDWCSSQKIEFEAKENIDTRFTCQNALGGSRSMQAAAMGLFYLLFLPHKYLKLEEAQPSIVQRGAGSHK